MHVGWSNFVLANCFCKIRVRTLIPRLMVQTKLSPGMTDAIVTEAPNLVNVSVIHVVSISSLPSAIGTRTFFFDIFREEVADEENLFLKDDLNGDEDNELRNFDDRADDEADVKKASDVDEDLPTTSRANVRNRTM